MFFAVGFETTAPSTARHADPGPRRPTSCNFSVFCNHVTIVPPIKAILDSPDLRLDGFLGPGHVSTVVGQPPVSVRARGIRQAAGDGGLRAARHPPGHRDAAGAAQRGPVRGREPVHPDRPRRGQPPGAADAWPRCSSCGPTSNGGASGFIAQSALRLRAEFAPWDAELRYAVPGVRVADPKACQCGEVLKGVIKPWECKVFGTACTPETPDRHLHGVVRRGLRRLLQLRPAASRGGGHAGSGVGLASARAVDRSGHRRHRASTPTGEPGPTGRGSHRPLPSGRARLVAVLVGDAHGRYRPGRAALLVDRTRASGRATVGACGTRLDARPPGPRVRRLFGRRRRARGGGGVPAGLDRSEPARPSTGWCTDGPLPPSRRRHGPRHATTTTTTTTTITVTSATTPATSTPASERVAVLESILAENDRIAAANRRDFATPASATRQPDVVARRGQDDAAQADPGRASASRLRVGVLEGDIATSLDADRARRPRRRRLARQHERRLRRRVPPRRGHGPLRPAAGCRSTTSTC